MGVIYSVCECCGNIFGDGYGESHCSVCGTDFCEECSKKYELVYDDESDELVNCPVCSKDFIKDSEIFTYLFKKLNTTKEKIIEEIKGVK